MAFNHRSFRRNLGRLRERIGTVCEKCGRSPDSINLMAVTKGFPLEVAATAVEAGLTTLGENRVQEGVGKIKAANFPAQWELIGHLQSNKAQLAVKCFHRIQSVDSVKLALRLNRMAAANQKKLPILLQVNTGEDPGKFGFRTEEMEAVLHQLLGQDGLAIQGLMTIAPAPPNLESARQSFETLRRLRDRLEERLALRLPELSMGMTFDLEPAIAAGSTCLRVGSGLFGPRPK
ncbi:MAG: YggS family pyridoxal phosphate-dependent enzyme [Opitutae bacterium]|nr:YggS family pyridoxal phosphate-dependent enzyme [Opitutae bacterium]MBC9889554.1 YggS family pyridoxal phosphate-dependent enzyme [Opitutae bacterium]